MLTLLDTNVLLRAAEPSHSQHFTAVQSMRVLQASGHSFCVIPQVLYEVWVVATRPVAQNGLGMSVLDAGRELDRLGPPLFRLYRDERAIYDCWRPLVVAAQVKGKSAHDARLVAAMQRHGLTHLLTFNSADFRRYKEIEVMDPVVVAAT